MPTINCPNCDAKFRSKKDLTGKQVRCPRCDSAFVVDDEAEEIVLPRSAAAAPPRAVPPKSRPTSKTKNRKPARGKKRKASSAGGGFPKPLLICLGIALLAGAGWYGLEAFNQGALPIPGMVGGGGGVGQDSAAASGGGGLAGALGLVDTPESLMEEYTDMGQELTGLLAGVNNPETAQQAAVRIAGMSSELIELRRRAVLATAVPAKQLADGLRRFYEDETLRQSHVEWIADRQESQFSQYPALTEAIDELGSMGHSTKYTIEEGLKQLPEPENEFDRIEHERTSILRQICRHVMQIDGPDDVTATARFARQQATTLQGLADRLKSTTGLSMQSARARQKYMPFDPSLLIDAQLIVLERGGLETEPVDQAMIDVSTATSNIDFAQPQRATAQRGGNSSAFRGDPGQSPGGGSMRGGRGFGAGRGGPGGIGLRGRAAGERTTGGRALGGGQQPSTGSEAADPDEVVVVLQGDVFQEEPPNRREMIAIRKLQREVVMAAQKVLETNIQRRGTNSHVKGALATIRLRYEAGPQALAERMTLGKVESVDAEKREIVVTISPDLVDQVRESLR